MPLQPSAKEVERKEAKYTRVEVRKGTIYRYDMRRDPGYDATNTAAKYELFADSDSEKLPNDEGHTYVRPLFQAVLSSLPTQTTIDRLFPSEFIGGIEDGFSQGFPKRKETKSRVIEDGRPRRAHDVLYNHPKAPAGAGPTPTVERDGEEEPFSVNPEKSETAIKNDTDRRSGPATARVYGTSYLIPASRRWRVLANKISALNRAVVSARAKYDSGWPSYEEWVAGGFSFNHSTREPFVPPTWITVKAGREWRRVARNLLEDRARRNHRMLREARKRKKEEADQRREQEEKRIQEELNHQARERALDRRYECRRTDRNLVKLYNAHMDAAESRLQWPDHLKIKGSREPTKEESKNLHLEAARRIAELLDEGSDLDGLD
jgi:hypothetical protein